MATIDLDSIAELPNIAVSDRFQICFRRNYSEGMSAEDVAKTPSAQRGLVEICTTLDNVVRAFNFSTRGLRVTFYETDSFVVHDHLLHRKERTHVSVGMMSRMGEFRPTLGDWFEAPRLERIGGDGGKTRPLEITLMFPRRKFGTRRLF